MTASPESQGDPSVDELQRIIAVCDRFEAAWRAGDNPRIEDFSTFVGVDSSELLWRLLSLELSLRREAGSHPRIDDYQRRFPESRLIVDRAFSEQTKSVEMPRDRPPQSSESSVEPLLMGIFALQSGFIDHKKLVAALRKRADDQTRAMDAILAEMGGLDPAAIEKLKALVREHRTKNDGDLQKSMEGLDFLEAARLALEQIDHLTLEGTRTLAPVWEEVPDPEATTAFENDFRLQDDPPLWSSTTRGRRFQKGQFFRAGNLGRVSRAFDRELRRNVAFKEIREDHARNPSSRSQFMIEGLVTGGLEHPGIVPVYGLGTFDDGKLYYAMRFIDGPSLKEKLAQLHGDPHAPALAEGEDRPTLPRLLRHFISACYAAGYAHSRGILHRDIKPEHIMIGPFGETLLVDWGLAMPVSQREPGDEDPTVQEPLELPPEYQSAFWSNGSRVGTPDYMSPEQSSGQNSRLDRRSDVYSLGATLFSLIVGRSPFKGVPDRLLEEKVRTGDFKRPRQVNPSVPPALEAICLKAMGLAPEDRYDTALDLARDLERWLDDEPTVAYTEPWQAKAARWVRRHKTATVGVASVLVCAVIGLSVLNVQMGWANEKINEKAIALSAANVKAERNFQLASGAVNGLLVRIASSELPHIPRTEGLRHEIASDATKYLNALSTETPEPRWLRLQAKGYRELAKIKQLLGEKDALNDYKRAVEFLRETVPPGGTLSASNKDEFAETLIDFAEMLRVSGEPASAEPLFLEALSLATELNQEFGKNPRYQFTLAWARCNLAELHIDLGDYRQSVVLGKQAVERLREFADEKNPKDNTQKENARLVLPFALVNLGVV